MSDDLIKELELYKSITKEDLLTNKLSPLNYRKKGNELAIKEELKKLKTKKEQYKFILDNLELGNHEDGYFRADYQLKLLRKIQIEEPWLHEEYISGLKGFSYWFNNTRLRTDLLTAEISLRILISLVLLFVAKNKSRSANIRPLLLLAVDGPSASLNPAGLRQAPV